MNEKETARQTLIRELVSHSLKCQPYFHDESTLIVETRQGKETLFLKLKNERLEKNTRGLFRLDFLATSYNRETDTLKRGVFRIYFNEDGISKTVLKLY